MSDCETYVRFFSHSHSSFLFSSFLGYFFYRPGVKMCKKGDVTSENVYMITLFFLDRQFEPIFRNTGGGGPAAAAAASFSLTGCFFLVPVTWTRILKQYAHEIDRQTDRLFGTAAVKLGWSQQQFASSYLVQVGTTRGEMEEGKDEKVFFLVLNGRSSDDRRRTVLLLRA